LVYTLFLSYTAISIMPFSLDYSRAEQVLFTV
jgi:hypothetical protein